MPYRFPITVLSILLLFGSCGRSSSFAAPSLPVVVASDWWPPGLRERDGWKPEEIRVLRAALYLAWLALPTDDPRRGLVFDARYVSVEPGEGKHSGHPSIIRGGITAGDCDVLCARPGSCGLATLATVLSHELFHLAHDPKTPRSLTDSNASEWRAHKQGVQDCERMVHLLPSAGPWRDQMRVERADNVLTASLYEVRMRVLELVDHVERLEQPTPGSAVDRLLRETVDREGGELDLKLEPEERLLDRFEAVLLARRSLDHEGFRLLRVAREAVDAVAPADAFFLLARAELRRGLP